MPRLPTLGLALVVLLLGGCGLRRPVATPWLALSPGARLYADNTGQIRDSVRTVVRDEGTLRLYWQQASAGQTSPPPVPTVDFTREMVLVVAAGRMKPDDEIRVDSVRVRRETDASGRTEEVMSVMVHTREGCGRLSTPAFPVEVVRVRRFDGRVSFLSRRVRADC